MAPNDGTVMMENARIIFRNFAGVEGQFNREGDRNFAVLLDDELAEKLLEDGWNVKHLRPREEGDPAQAYLSITVGYKGRPPRVVMITSRGRTVIDEDMIETLDWVDIKTVDLIIRPYTWAVGDKSGIKAYLKSLFVTIYEDALELKYADLEDLPARAGRVDD
jgi:hypothetical protein